MKAIRISLVNGGFDKDEINEVMKAYGEFLELERHLVAEEIDDENVTWLPAYGLYNLLNETIYDDVSIMLTEGKDVNHRSLYKQINDHHPGLYEIPPSVFMDAAATIKDLWRDNKSAEHCSQVPLHNADGTFATFGDTILYKMFREQCKNSFAAEKIAQEYGLNYCETEHFKNAIHRKESL